MAKAPKPCWTGAAALRPLLVPITSLTLDPRNPRRHSGRNLEAIEASLRTFGQQKSILVRKQDRQVVAGNGTVQAAKLLGWTHVAAVLEPMTAEQARAFSVADNRTAELAEWDRDHLADILRAEDDEDLLGAMGFDAREIDELLRGEAAAGEAADPVEREPASEPAQEPEQPAIAKPGDLWTLGRHQVLCASQKSRGGAAWVRDQKPVGTVATGDERDVDEREKAFVALLKACAPDGTVMLDVDGRDGAFLMACELTGRSARVLSCDPHQVDLIVARWERQTGGKAERKRATQRRGVAQADFVYPPDRRYHGD